MHPFDLKTLLRLAGLFLALAGLTPAGAGQFGVSPLRIDLDRGARSGAITVSNDEEAEPLRVQLRLFEWTQEDGGKDEYRESDDLLYFPRLMTLEKAEQKLVRVGLRAPAPEREKAYRLFVEELPAPPTPGGARVAIAVRFGVPVFVKPAREDMRGEIDTLSLEKGVLRIGVRNSGNQHFTIESVTASAGQDFSRQLPGWYLLAGAAREHAIDIPAQVCARLKQIDVAVKTDTLELKGTLGVNATMCGP